MTDKKETLLIWLKHKEILALGTKKTLTDKGDDYAKYFDGKAQAYSEVWEHLLADGQKLNPIEYNKLNEEYSRIVAEVKQ